MALKQVFRSTKRRVRLGVGLLLAALFCIQCSQSSAFRDGLVGKANGMPAVGDVQLARLEELARTDHIALLKEGIARCRSGVRDYRCKFSKQERINGVLRPVQEMEVKFREEPFSVAMHVVKNPPLGDRVLYVEGRHNGQMVVNPAGMLVLLTGGAVLRNPQAKEVMANTLRPVTGFGFRRSMESLLGVYELAAQRNECSVRFLGYCTVAGRKAMKLERVLPPRKDYPAKTTTWYLDVENLLLLGLEGTDWDDRLLCSYFYEDFEFNVGLTDADFTVEANGMKLAR